MTEERKQEILNIARRVSEEKARQNPDERILDLWVYLAELGKGDPTTIIMNEEFFAKWYYYCEEHELDYMNWRGHQILIDPNMPFACACSYHPEQELVKKFE